MLNTFLHSVVHFLLCSEAANAKPEEGTEEELCITVGTGEILLANSHLEPTIQRPQREHGPTSLGQSFSDCDL
jgi:hypothetical protein